MKQVARLSKARVEEIDRHITYVRMLASVSRLSKMDRSSWKYLHRPGTSISGGANAYYYRELEKKLLKFVHPLNLWKKTRGDADKVLKLIKPVFSRKDYQTIVKFLREGKR